MLYVKQPVLNINKFFEDYPYSHSVAGNHQKETKHHEDVLRSGNAEKVPTTRWVWLTLVAVGITLSALLKYELMNAYDKRLIKLTKNRSFNKATDN